LACRVNDACEYRSWAGSPVLWTSIQYSQQHQLFLSCSLCCVVRATIWRMSKGELRSYPTLLYVATRAYGVSPRWLKGPT